MCSSVSLVVFVACTRMSELEQTVIAALIQRLVAKHLANEKPKKYHLFIKIAAAKIQVRVELTT